ncbi:MAG: hypothetical protein KJZ80_14310 [Hyphomicrobiaceae bacterium]|nr:hypothetical protein [Hyphomicrobiaceae bacterium]
MSESEILQGLFDAIDAIMALFSLFLTMVSGYLAALYLFLNRAPLTLRLMAFGLLSIGLVFLGGTAAVIQTMQDNLFATWNRLPSPPFDIDLLRNPLPLPVEVSETVPLSQQQLGVGVGWSVALAVYLALAYMTFVYRWPLMAERTKEPQTHAHPDPDARPFADHGGGQARQVARQGG